MSIQFCKFHGFGNDYIVIDADSFAAGVDLPRLAPLMCNRNTGVGSDGLAILTRRDGREADHFCEIVNPDGSVAGFSGNGTRCAVAYLHFKGLWSEPRLRLETRSGIKVYTLIEQRGPGEFWFEAEIGSPRFSSDDIPVASETRIDSVLNQRVLFDDRPVVFSAVNVGNPVAGVFVSEFPPHWREIGKMLETQTTFPDRTNVVFIRVRDRENVEVRIWERGAGETSSSGTCSAGAAVLSAFMLKTDRTVNVHSPGGLTKVVWRDDNEIVLTGRADLAFCGEWTIGRS